MKVCKKCGDEKSEEHFYPSSTGKGGLQFWCKSCTKAHQQEYAKKNRSWIRNRENARNRANPEILRKKNLRFFFGLSTEEYDRILQLQGGVCAICRGKCSTGKRLAVDHKHGTFPKKIRGLLCFACNGSLGKLKESPGLFRAAAAYLEKWENI